MVIYTSRFVQQGFAATTRGPLIFIRPAYRGDHGLHSLLYAASKSCRLSAEKYGLNISADAALKRLRQS